MRRKADLPEQDLWNLQPSIRVEQEMDKALGRGHLVLGTMWSLSEDAS